MAIRKPPADRPGTPLTNRNFLSPTGFKFSLKRAPAVAFFCQVYNILAEGFGEEFSLEDISVAFFS